MTDGVDALTETEADAAVAVPGQYAANALSISVPFAGAELAMVFSYRQFRRHGVDAATTGWTLAVSAIVSASALAFLLAIAAFTGPGSLASAAGLAGAVVFMVPGAAVLLALRFERWPSSLTAARDLADPPPAAAV